jgi:hypothetical protein
VKLGVLLAAVLWMASPAAAESLVASPDPDMPTLWTRWAQSLPFLPLDDCEVEVESDLSFVLLSFSVRF